MSKNISFDKERSVKRCVVDAWSIFALDWRSYLKNTCVYLLFVGLAAAFGIELLVRYLSEHALPAYRLYEMKGNPDLIKLIALPQLDSAVYMALSVVVLLIACYAFAGRMLRMIRFYAGTNKLPQKMSLWLSAKERKLGLRFFVMDAFFFVLALILTALISYGALQWFKWILLLLPVCLFYIWTTSHVARLNYAFRGQTFKEALRASLHKSLGYSLLVQMLMYIPAFFLYLTFLLPLFVYAFAALAGADSVLMGDALGIPDYLPVLFFFINSLGIAVCALVGMVRTWALAMK